MGDPLDAFLEDFLSVSRGLAVHESLIRVCLACGDDPNDTALCSVAVNNDEQAKALAQPRRPNLSCYKRAI